MLVHQRTAIMMSKSFGVVSRGVGSWVGLMEDIAKWWIPRQQLFLYPCLLHLYQ